MMPGPKWKNRHNFLLISTRTEEALFRSFAGPLQLCNLIKRNAAEVGHI